MGASRRPLGGLLAPPGASGGPLGGVQEAPKRVFKGIHFSNPHKGRQRVGWLNAMDPAVAVLGGSLEVSNRHPGSLKAIQLEGIQLEGIQKVLGHARRGKLGGGFLVLIFFFLRRGARLVS